VWQHELEERHGIAPLSLHRPDGPMIATISPAPMLTSAPRSASTLVRRDMR
jgi:hypothetical protein